MGILRFVMILIYFWFFLTFLEVSTAELKSCDEEIEESICTTKDFSPLFPPGNSATILETELRLLDVHQINLDEKSISLYIELFTFWNDTGISTSNGVG